MDAHRVAAGVNRARHGVENTARRAGDDVETPVVLRQLPRLERAQPQWLCVGGACSARTRRARDRGRGGNAVDGLDRRVARPAATPPPGTPPSRSICCIQLSTPAGAPAWPAERTPR